MNLNLKGPQPTPATVPGGPTPSAQVTPPGGAKLLQPGWRPMLRKAQPPGAAKRMSPGSEPF